MNLLMILFALLGGSADQKNFDPATMVAKHIIKGVYDEKRVEAVAYNQEKYPKNKLD